MKLRLSDYLKGLILNGEENPHLRDGYLLWDSLIISKDKVEYKHRCKIVGFMDIPSKDLDFKRGDILTLEMFDSKNKIWFEDEIL